MIKIPVIGDVATRESDPSDGVIDDARDVATYLYRAMPWWVSGILEVEGILCEDWVKAVKRFLHSLSDGNRFDSLIARLEAKGWKALSPIGPDDYPRHNWYYKRDWYCRLDYSDGSVTFQRIF